MSPVSRTLSVIEFTVGHTDKTSKVDLISIDHGENTNGRNIVAVVGGNLHSDGSCAWCNCLIIRCQSRRIA